MPWDILVARGFHAIDAGGESYKGFLGSSSDVQQSADTEAAPSLSVPVDSVVPVETLNLIFHFLRDVEPTRALSDLPRGALGYIRPHSLSETSRERARSFMHLRHGWLKVTHVSRRWRAIALGDPSLWTRIPFNLGHLWSLEFVERCLSKHLDVELPSTFAPWMTPFIRKHYQQFRTLLVEYSLPPNADATIDSLSAVSSHNMQTLVLARSWAVVDRSWLNVFRASQLREMVLSFSTMRADLFPWGDIHFPNLTALGLGFYVSPSILSRSSLLLALQQLTSLVAFELHCHIPEDADTVPPDTILTSPRICWDRLERMSITADSSTVIHLASHIQYPPSTTVFLHSIDLIERTPLKTVLIPAFAEQYGSSSVKKLYIHDVKRRTQQNVVVVDMKAQIWMNDGPVSVSTLIPGDSPDVLSNLLLDIKASSIRELHLRLSRGLDPQARPWLARVKRLRNVTNACIHPFHDERQGDLDSSSTLAIVLRALFLPATLGHETNPPPFPELVALDLRSACVAILSGPCTNAGSTPPLLVAPTFAEVLADILRRRREAGVAVRQVHLRASTGMAVMTKVEADSLNLLRSLPEVEWSAAGGTCIKSIVHPTPQSLSTITAMAPDVARLGEENMPGLGESTDYTAAEGSSHAAFRPRAEEIKKGGNIVGAGFKRLRT
ncbi:hypothetical protein PENSPDRAFT_670662 [Peniophora sp. CONT]|nr:hypothetical protein PENSPDRAFT_670662 [Peniophora sp. CONT]